MIFLQKYLDLNDEPSDTENTTENTSQPVTVLPNFDFQSSVGILGKTLHKCSYCGFGFYVDNGVAYSGIYGGSTVTCPKCGSVNKI